MAEGLGLGLASALRNVITEVGVASSLTPEVRVDPFQVPGGQPHRGDALSELALRVLRPQVTVYTPAGPLRLAPWGEPNRVVGIVVAVLVVVGAYRILAR